MRIRKNCFSKAFTLVELLVVVMIILLLAGMLLPAISGARRRGRDVICKNNLKQLQVAAMTYAVSEGNGALPHARSTENYVSTRTAPKWRKNNTGWLDWVNYNNVQTGSNDPGDRRPGETPWWGSYGLTCITNGTLWKYVKSTKAYACPEWLQSIDGQIGPLGAAISLSDTNRYPWRCYGMNYMISGSNIGDIEASKRLLFAEVGSTNFFGTTQIAQNHLRTPYAANQLTSTTLGPEAYAWDGTFSVSPVASQNYPQENVGLNHNGKANVIFADGHIETLDWRVTTNAASGNW